MAVTFVSEPIEAEKGSFNPTQMSAGAPGLPATFRWRDRTLVVGDVLEQWKDYGDCTHGSGERYVRKHIFRIRLEGGEVARIYFQRSFGRSRATARWWLHSLGD